jgi:uncharacterized protein (DUF488 family)
MSSKKNTRDSPKGEVFTIGHSVHPLEEFMALLKTYHIQLLVDIRTLPGSKRVPQYNKENLAPSLEAEGIAYIHMKDLGGLRHTTKASPNTAWRNKSFRGFADYMQTPEFIRGLEELIRDARERRTVIMCAEAVPWRCHRSLVGDALLVRGFAVKDIFTAKKWAPHQLTSFAHVDGLKITYPAVP